MEKPRGAVEVTLEVGGRAFKLIKHAPLPIENVDTDRHLFRMSSVFHRFFTAYTETFISSFLSGSKQPAVAYRETVDAIDEDIVSNNLSDFVTRYDYLFQYRNLLRRIEKVSFDDVNELSDLVARLKYEISDQFNQARTTQNIPFLNVVSSHGIRIPEQIRILLASSSSRVAITAVKYSVREMTRGLRPYFICYDANSLVAATDIITSIRNGLEAKAYMPLHQEF